MFTDRVCRTGRNVILIGIGVVGLSSWQSVAAQTGLSGSTETPRNSAEPRRVLETIVVTAQRRAETAQSVPVSITAVGADHLEEAAIQELDQLTQGIVGITYSGTSTSTPELYIRGIGTNRRDVGSDPSSGVYIDEIYQPRFSNVLSGLVDIERVEVLRGPQGTLFGRNTIGGAVSTFTADPTGEFEGKVSLSAGNQDYVSGSASVSIPVNDRLGVRLSGGYSDREGFMSDTVTGNDDGVRSYTVRSKIVYDITDNVVIKLGGSHFESKQNFTGLQPANTPLFLAGPLKPQIIDDDPYSGSYTLPGGNDIEHSQVDGRLIWDHRAMTTTFIASWIGFDQTSSGDLDATINDNVDYMGDAQSDTYSAELRFTSTAGGVATFGSKLKWVGGFYYFQDDATEVSRFTAGLDSPIAFLLANPGLLVNPDLPPPYNPPNFRKSDQTNIASDVTSIAVYAQGSYSLTDQLSLTLGARYTEDERDYVHTSISGLPGVPVPIVPVAFVYPDRLSSTSFDPKLGLEFTPVEDVLFYASYTEGFKSGAVQSTAITQAVAANSTRPERVEAYEIGLKSEFFSNRLRLNMSAFVNEFQDLQVRRVVVFPGGFSTAVIENAADSTIQGVEIEASALLTPQLRANASYAYLDATYDQYIVDEAAGIDFSGNRMSRAPEHRYNVDVTYTTQLSNNTELQLRAAYNHMGEFFFQPSNRSIDRESSYGLTDLSAQLVLPGGTTTLQLWGRNVFDVEYRNYVNVLDQETTEGYGDRRTFGVKITQQF